MALALVDFEALCGFVEHEQLVAALEANPELRQVIGEAMASLLASAGDNAQLRCVPCYALWQTPIPCAQFLSISYNLYIF